MTNRLRDLKAAESEVYNLTIEKERMIEEMEAMKSRVREMMLEKLSAERKMSEAIARNTRNEVSFIWTGDLMNRIRVPLIIGNYEQKRLSWNLDERSE